MRQMRLRYAGTCASCAVKLVPRTEAWWDSASKEVYCPACGGPAPVTEALTAPPPVVDGTIDPPVGAEDLSVSVGAAPVEVAEVDSVTLTDEERGIAGASARAERVRRTQKREDGIRARHKRIGGFLVAISEDPTSTKVWDQGAIGEERVGEWLENARPQGIEVLHDRRIPRSRANIDHLVIAPSGIWVVDPKRYLNGKLQQRDVGGWSKTDMRLFVGSRDKTSLVDGVQKQIDHVTKALVATPFAAVPVRGALCFVEIETGWFAKPFTMRGITVTWRKYLLPPMLEPELVAPDVRATLVPMLASYFKPA
jgi:hypothetical protein